MSSTNPFKLVTQSASNVVRAGSLALSSGPYWRAYTFRSTTKYLSKIGTTVNEG